MQKDSSQHCLFTVKSLEITKLFEIPIQWNILQPLKRMTWIYICEYRKMPEYMAK